MSKQVSKKNIVESLALLLWIFCVNVATPLITHADTWPMFLILISFFFVEDLKQIKKIYVGAITGILIVAGLFFAQDSMLAAFGQDGTTLLVLAIILSAVFIGGNFLPTFLNNVTFLYITLCTLDVTVIGDRFVSWILMAVIGGTIALGGALLLLKVVDSKYDDVKEEAKAV